MSQTGWCRTDCRLGTRSTARPQGQKGGAGSLTHRSTPPASHAGVSQNAGWEGKRLVLLKRKCEATGLRCNRDGGHTGVRRDRGGGTWATVVADWVWATEEEPHSATQRAAALGVRGPALHSDLPVGT